MSMNIDLDVSPYYLFLFSSKKSCAAGFFSNSCTTRKLKVQFLAGLGIGQCRAAADHVAEVHTARDPTSFNTRGIILNPCPFKAVSDRARRWRARAHPEPTDFAVVIFLHSYGTPSGATVNGDISFRPSRVTTNEMMGSCVLSYELARSMETVTTHARWSKGVAYRLRHGDRGGGRTEFDTQSASFSV
jgi:hypothetical protein